MKIKNVVKVMNFHSLLKVDKSRRTAEKYFSYEDGLTEFTRNILNNRNLLLDKKVLKLDSKKPPLNIYIANDMGFCGNYNSNVNRKIMEENADKIIIGKKILGKKDMALLAFKKEDYSQNKNKLEDILYDSIINKKNSSINLIYNHYYNVSKIDLVEKRILPLEKIEKQGKTYYEDFTVEGDINEILTNVIVLYLSYEIRVAIENSYASENVARQKLTTESLKKIDEIEEENTRKERKQRNQKAFKKVTENFIKLRSREGEWWKRVLEK